MNGLIETEFLPKCLNHLRVLLILTEHDDYRITRNEVNDKKNYEGDKEQNRDKLEKPI
jgi:hypothetical protein